MQPRKRAGTKFGRWLDRQMARVDTNISGLAALVGKSQSTVSDWRRGVTMPTDESIQVLAAALRVPVTGVYAALGRIPEDTELSEDERRFLENFHGLDSGQRELLDAMMTAMLEQQERNPQEDDDKG